ncbi:hypothetical protein E2C01_089281 [Portunus trituberculatus]|uniref:Uncharacterized protein n=1 Tax=Portunus trituberculatus TaxID=210409 RepID=A0A5B7JGT3_PORTR|nr:hypothetical protein [Portunus trituberculatus]
MNGTSRRPRIVHVDRLWAVVEEGHFTWGQQGPPSSLDSEMGSDRKMEGGGEIENVAECVVGVMYLATPRCHGPSPRLSLCQLPSSVGLPLKLSEYLSRLLEAVCEDVETAGFVMSGDTDNSRSGFDTKIAELQ